jgi:tRNA-dihydrouridine synthase
MRGGRVSGVLVGRGALRNPWIFAQASDLAARRQPRGVTMEDRGQFLLDYIDLLLSEGIDEQEGFRHSPAFALRATAGQGPSGLRGTDGRDRSRERWVVNKVRALGSWYTKGLENGGHLRVAINSAGSVAPLRDLIRQFFFAHEGEAIAPLKGGGHADTCSRRS